MSEKLTLRTEVEGLELKLEEGRLFLSLNGDSVKAFISQKNAEKLERIFRLKEDPNWNFFERCFAIADYYAKRQKTVAPTV